MKIQVSDDYFAKNLNASKYGYSCKNFSYAGSLSSSMNSSCDSGHLDNEFRGVPMMKPLECNVNNTSHRFQQDQNEQHGLYSVKNASIRYDESNANSKNDPLSNLIVMSYEACPFTLSAKNESRAHTNELNSIDYGNHPLESFYGTSVSGNLSNAFQIAQIQSQNSKVNTLKQLKKDLALKKQVASAYNNSNLNNRMIPANNISSINCVNSEQTCSNQNDIYQQKHLETYQYLKNSELLLGQHDIIASVV